MAKNHGTTKSLKHPDDPDSLVSTHNERHLSLTYIYSLL